MLRRRRTLWFALLGLTLLLLPSSYRPAAWGARPSAQAPPFTILLSNDDGYVAPGLRAMIEAFRGAGELHVAAPATEQSGKGHSITTRDPILVHEQKQPDGVTWHAVEAPPATCVRLAIDALLPRRPHLVISGINRGENLGVVVYYSGTLGGAREAAFSRIPAIAVSMQGNDAKGYAATASFLRDLVEQLRARQALQPGFFLNVNAPAGEPKGVRVTRLSLQENQQLFERRTSPRGQLYFWSSYRPLADDEEGTDVWAFVRGYITLTPMDLDVTSYQAMETLRAFEREAVPVKK